MSSVIILQARTSSSRLPAKVLLPVKEIPLVVLAAKRAANTGREVVVATSSEESDDALAALVESNGLQCFRGSLENTLDRFVSALNAYEDQTVVFRLTSDNVFPDGALLDEIEEEFLTKGFEYLCCNGDSSGLPYGMSVEVTRLLHLREAARESVLAYDQEHVTPYVVRKFGLNYFQKYKYLKKGHFRCTIDCLDDYLSVLKVFSDVVNPVLEPAFELVRKLEMSPSQPFTTAPISRLIFGAAQLGSNYGIANTTGQPDKRECQKLIKTAITNGVIYLDTAHAYGNSEAVIGASLRDGWEGRAKVITKLSPFLDCSQETSTSNLNAFVDASLYKSLSALRVNKIDVLMLHRASHLTDWNGRVWQRLLEFQNSNVIGELGVSVQNPQELLIALDVAEVRYIQLPFNILDWRWDSVIPKILATKASRKLDIHVRSVLLQGLLSSIDEENWQKANEENALTVISWLKEQAAIFDRVNVIDLCISYVNALPWVDGIAMGMENLKQLIENLHYFGLSPLSANQIETIKSTRPQLSEDTLNPARWR